MNDNLSLLNEITFIEFLAYELTYALFAGFVLFLAYRFGFFKYNKYKSTPYAAGWQVLLAFGGTLLVSLLVPLTVNFLSNTFYLIPFEALYWAAPISQLLFATFLASLFLYYQKPDFSAFGNKLKSFLLGVFTWFIVYPQFLFVAIFFAQFVKIISPEYQFVEQDPVRQLLALKENPFALLGTIFAIIVAAPVVEEILFRGFLQGWFKSKFGALPAVFSTSLVFSLLHVSQTQGMTNIVLVPALFLLSCYLGYLYEREKSLAAPIGLHMAFNAVSVLFLIFQ